MLTLSPRRQSHILRNVFVMLGWNVETSHRITKRVYKNYHCYQQFLPWSWMQLISPAMAKFVVVWRWKWGIKEKRREKNYTFVWRSTSFSSHTIYVFNCLFFFFSCCYCQLLNFAVHLTCHMVGIFLSFLLRFKH